MFSGLGKEEKGIPITLVLQEHQKITVSIDELRGKMGEIPPQRTHFLCSNVQTFWDHTWAWGRDSWGKDPP